MIVALLIIATQILGANSNLLIINDDIDDNFEEIKEPFCPKCASKMPLRKGRYTGKNF